MQCITDVRKFLIQANIVQRILFLLQFFHHCRGGISALHLKILRGTLYRYLAHFKDLEQTNISAQNRGMYENPFLNKNYVK